MAEPEADQDNVEKGQEAFGGDLPFIDPSFVTRFCRLVQYSPTLDYRILEFSAEIVPNFIILVIGETLFHIRFAASLGLGFITRR